MTLSSPAPGRFAYVSRSAAVAMLMMLAALIGLGFAFPAPRLSNGGPALLALDWLFPASLP